MNPHKLIPLLVMALALVCVGWMDVSQAADGPVNGRVQLIPDLHGLSGPVTGVAFSPDERHVAACGGKEVRIWDLQTGQLHYTLRGQIGGGSQGDCLAVAFSPDNCHFAVGISNDAELGSIRIYDTHHFHEIKELLPGHRRPVTRLAFSGDSRYLATADNSGTITIFDWPLRRIVATAQPADHANGLYPSFSFPTRDTMLVVRGTKETTVVAVPSGQILADDRYLAPITGQWLKQHQQATWPGAAADSFVTHLDQDAWLACGAAADGSGTNWAALWRSDGVKPKVVYRGHLRRITSIALSNTRALAASCDQSGEVHVWDVASGQVRHILRDGGQPIYRAAFNQATRQIAFTSQALVGKQAGYNRFGQLDRAFDLNRHGISPVARADAFPVEVTQRGRARLQIGLQGQNPVLQMTGTSGMQAALGLPAGARPACYTLLGHQQFGIADPVILGDERGGIFCHDLAKKKLRRSFLGHAGFVTSLSESADGKLLTTSSTDRTIRLWSLADGLPAAWLDFEMANDLVTNVRAGSPAEKAGIRVGDRFVSLDGKSLSELSALQSSGQSPYKVGQRGLVTMDRGGVGYQADATLVAGPDLVEPLLSLLVTPGNDWVLWTPEGYFDASPGAGDLIGFHVNRGPQYSAQFLPVHQFRQQLYRPDIIDQVLERATVRETVIAVNATLPEAPAAIDLRQTDAINKFSPPQVRVLSPQPDTVTQDGSIHVLAEVISADGSPLTDVKLLVNGRPGAEKGIEILADDADNKTRRSISQAVSLLPGENTLAVLASNAHATSVPVTFTVTYQAPPEVRNRQPKLHLLSIGVSKYANERLNLRYAHLDAQDFAQSWQGQRSKLYREVAGTLLVNEEASSGRIKTALKDLVSAVERHDVAVIFISAHGVRDSQLDYYLGSHDVDPKDLPNTGVHFSALTQLLEQLPCKVLMFADTCHSAGITGAKAIVTDPIYELSSDEYGAIIFASSLSREISLEDEAWGHGAFTKAILETFGDQASDLNGDGYLSLTELEQRVYDRVQKLTNGAQHPVMSRPATVPNLRFFQLGVPKPLAATR